MNKNWQQACAIPYRKKNGEITFCLITSRGRGDWIFPKGNIDGTETSQQTALKEAYEEAGIQGRIICELGQFSYEKRGYTLLVSTQLMEVTLCQQQWLEKKYRNRCWVSSLEAERLIQRTEMKKELKKAVDYLKRTLN